MSSPARRRYTRSVLLLFVVYFGALTGAIGYFQEKAPEGAAAYFAAVLPALPILGIFYAVARYLIEESDEYQRMKLVRQSLVATGFMLTVTTIWGFLQSFGLAPHVDFYWAAILWFAGLGLGSLVNRFSFGEGGC